MAISKIILNGEVQMDVTSDTAAASNMLNGTTATKNDGTKVTGTIASKSSSDLTASGATVTAPAGYYLANASKSIAAGSAKTPATTITANPSVSIDSDGLITATVSGSKNITPTVSAGYVSSGTAGTVSVSGSGTKQLTTKAASTINASTSDQSIAAGTYLTGAQTIKGVTTSNLTAANIKSGTIVKVGDANNATRIANVTGTFSSSSTVSSGQTAAGSGQILSGYSAFVNGAEVKGNITSKSSSNLTVSGATVTAPAGYYAAQASKSVASGSAGTPILIVGDLNAHLERKIYAEVTNTTGYIEGSTLTGESVTFDASQFLDDSIMTITENGIYDVTYYASVDVSVEAASSDPQFGTFTITANSTTTQMRIGYITMCKYSTSDEDYYPAYVATSTENSSSMNNNYRTGRWIINPSDGYMYVTFVGANDSYTPVITATSGTATLISTSGGGTMVENKNKFGYAERVYKISDGAVLTASYVDNG